MSDDDSDAGELDRVKGVFVGEVVADVDRQQRTGRVETLADPGQRGPLVPVEVGPQFDDHAPAGHPEAVLRSELMHRGDDLTNPVGRHLAVVHRDGKALVLDANSRNPRQAPGQFGGSAFEDGYERGGRFVLMMGAVRSGHLEPVAACVPEVGYADPVADIGEVATAQDGHRAHFGHEFQRLGGTVDKPGRTGIRNDGG